MIHIRYDNIKINKINTYKIVYNMHYYNNNGHREMHYSNMTARMLPPIHINTK